MEKLRIYPVMILAVIIFSSAGIIGCKGSSLNPAQELLDIPYGSDPQNRFDISLPGGRTIDTPVIILFHGGGWVSGDKSDFNYLRKYFCRRGFAVFSVNYRLANVEGKGVEYILKDVSAAIALIKEMSSRWIYSKDCIFLTGHSAGGHIALMYAFTLDTSRSIRGVVSFCGVTDLSDPLLREFLRRRQSEGKPGSKSFDLLDFITGGSIKDKKRYSPLYTASRVPVILFHGKLDTIIPWQQSADLHSRMISKGYESSLYLYPDMTHDISIHYTEIMTIAESWIRAHQVK